MPDTAVMCQDISLLGASLALNPAHIQRPFEFALLHHLILLVVFRTYPKPLC